MLYELLDQALVSGDQESEPLALMLMDLDRFKEVIDTMGHHRGDFCCKKSESACVVRFEIRIRSLGSVAMNSAVSAENKSRNRA